MRGAVLCPDDLLIPSAEPNKARTPAEKPSPAKITGASRLERSQDRAKRHAGSFHWAVPRGGLPGPFLASYASIEAMAQFRLAWNPVAISPTCAWMLVLAAAAVGGT